MTDLKWFKQFILNKAVLKHLHEEDVPLLAIHMLGSGILFSVILRHRVPRVRELENHADFGENQAGFSQLRKYPLPFSLFSV